MEKKENQHQALKGRERISLRGKIVYSSYLVGVRGKGLNSEKEKGGRIRFSPLHTGRDD